MLAAAPRRLIPEMLYISHSLPELSPRAIVVSATVTKPLVAGRHIPFVRSSALRALPARLQAAKAVKTLEAQQPIRGFDLAADAIDPKAGPRHDGDDEDPHRVHPTALGERLFPWRHHQKPIEDPDGDECNTPSTKNLWNVVHNSPLPRLTTRGSCCSGNSHETPCNRPTSRPCRLFWRHGDRLDSPGPTRFECTPNPA